MNVSKLNLVTLAQHISTSAASLANASALLASIIGTVSETAPAANAQATVTQAPNVTPFRAPETARKPAPVVSPETGTVTQTVGRDGRAHLPKALFEGLPSILVNGKEFKPFTSGRGKATAEELGASIGAVVTFYRQRPGVWVTTVNGQASAPAAPAQQAQAKPETPKATTPKASKVEITAADFFGSVGQAVAENAKAGVVNEHYPEGDPRRNMTRAQRKAFNRTVAATTRTQKSGASLADMAQAIGSRVYNVPANA